MQDDIQRPATSIGRFSGLQTTCSGTEPLITPIQVAERLGVSVDWVQAHATSKEPRIDHIRVGKLLRFRREQVESFIRRHAVTHS
jgi:excisionase family DNA binding protein